jgi:hypothetical protein
LIQTIWQDILEAALQAAAPQWTGSERFFVISCIISNYDVEALRRNFFEDLYKLGTVFAYILMWDREPRAETPGFRTQHQINTRRYNYDERIFISAEDYRECVERL